MSEEPLPKALTSNESQEIRGRIGSVILGLLKRIKYISKWDEPRSAHQPGELYRAPPPIESVSMIIESKSRIPSDIKKGDISQLTIIEQFGDGSARHHTFPNIEVIKIKRRRMILRTAVKPVAEDAETNPDEKPRAQGSDPL